MGGPRVDLQPQCKNLAETVEQAQGDDPATLEPINTTPAESSPGTSRAPSFSRYTPPSAALIPIARVQILEAQMATFLHHIQPWLKKSIVEPEDRIERKVSQQMEQKLQAVYQLLYEFEL